MQGLVFKFGEFALIVAFDQVNYCDLVSSGDINFGEISINGRTVRFWYIKCSADCPRAVYQILVEVTAIWPKVTAQER